MMANNIEQRWRVISRHMTVSLLVSLLTLSFFGAIAFFVHIESAIICNGKLVAIFNSKTIKHLEGGVVKDIYVTEGESVSKGQPLLSIQVNKVAEDVSTIKTKLNHSQAILERLKAQKGSIEFKWNEGYGFTHDIFLEQKAVFVLAIQEHKNAIKAIDIKVRKLKQQVHDNRKQLKLFAEKVNILKNEIATVENLLRTSNSTTTRLYKIQKELKNALIIENSTSSQVNEYLRDRDWLLNEKNNIKISYRSNIEVKINETSVKVKELRNDLKAIKDIYDRRTVYSPVNGIVRNNKVFSTGQVINSNDDLLEIVPIDDALVIEARLDPSEIESVTFNMPVKVFLTAYQAKIFSKLNGVLTYLDYNVTTDSVTNKQYYKIRITLDPDSDPNVMLYPGMLAKVYIITGKRTFAEMILYPILSQLNGSLR